jgi:hypothetical protein
VDAVAASSDFLAERRRCNVLRAGALYAAGAWLPPG